MRPSFFKIFLIVLIAGGVGLMFAGCRRKAALKLDQSTPLATVHSLIGAIDQHNAAEMRSCFLAQTPGQQAFVQAIVQLTEASAALQQRLTDRFGHVAAQDVPGSGAPSEEAFNRFVEGSQQIHDSSAVLTDRLGHTMELRKQSGDWKIVPDGAGSGEAGMERSTKAMTILAKILRDVADEVNDSAKYPAAADVKAEILRRQTAALVPSSGP